MGPSPVSSAARKGKEITAYPCARFVWGLSTAQECPVLEVIAAHDIYILLNPSRASTWHEQLAELVNEITIRVIARGICDCKQSA
jgi:hypothetical protein